MSAILDSLFTTDDIELSYFHFFILAIKPLVNDGVLVVDELFYIYTLFTAFKLEV